MKIKRQAKKYTLEFKKSSAKLAVESEQPISHTARALGVSSPALYTWVNKYEPHSKNSIASSIDANQSELKGLKKELTRVKQQRDRLKKAAAYFASETQ